MFLLMHEQRTETNKQKKKGGRGNVAEARREKDREEMEKVQPCVQTASYTINKSQEVCSFPIRLSSQGNIGQCV